MVAAGYILFYIICALNVIWGIKKKKSNALYGIALAVIFILMTFNSDGPDIEVYKTAYEQVGAASNLQKALNTTYMEKGYDLLMFGISKTGLDFYAFRIILTFICLVLFASTIKYYKVNPNFIIGLYMLYIFFFDTIQIRNCIIQFIILFATRYLFDKSGLSLLKYIVCIVVAGSIHTLAWLFLSLLLLRFFRSPKDYKTIFVFSAFLFIMCIFLQPILPKIVKLLAGLLNRGSGYLSGTLRFNYFVVMVLHLLGMMPLYLYRNRISDEGTKNKIETILKIDVVIGLFLPLCFINSNFNRIFRNVIILDTIGLTLLYQNLERSTESNDLTMAVQLMMVVGWLVTDLYRNRTVNIIDTVLGYNLVYMNPTSAEIMKYIVLIAGCLLLLFVIKKLLLRIRKQKKKELKCA